MDKSTHSVQIRPTVTWRHLEREANPPRGINRLAAQRAVEAREREDRSA
jgi:hypothetical protein